MTKHHEKESRKSLGKKNYAGNNMKQQKKRKNKYEIGRFHKRNHRDESAIAEKGS